MNHFTVGDKVMWTSSANGTTKTKVGIVIAVVFSNCNAQTYANEMGCKINSPGLNRDHTSYIVRLEGTNGKRVYWPRVNQLKPYGGFP